MDFEGVELGGTHKVEIEFRDPWQIIKQWVTDETLAPLSTWLSQEKYLCKDGIIDLSNRLYDEPCSGRTWGRIDVRTKFTFALLVLLNYTHRILSPSRTALAVTWGFTSGLTKVWSPQRSKCILFYCGRAGSIRQLRTGLGMVDQPWRASLKWYVFNFIAVN
jgi:hypothetical protein